ncbi:MAG: helix-turn-helix domain-containing protein [Solirubrobacterales bacterium]|nr:helix-turn-helix domain-containing protein [Solirubrobacterales bacterium]
MDLPARPDDALAQPTRARLFNLLDELRRPAGTEELAERLGLHPNGVRLHLERLRKAGLVVRERIRQARGRPRDMWMIAPDARPGGDPPSGYAQLGRWLARVISPGKTSLRRVEATGRDIGRELAPEGDCSAEEKMYAVLVSLGFQPRREAALDGGLTYRLCNCPYRDAVRASPEVVCTLHRGMTRGLLDGLAPRTTLAGFVPRDPAAAGCLVELRGGLAVEPLDQLSEPV